jgi:hypothetical protein
MTVAFPGLTHLPLVPIMMFGIALLLVGIAVFQNWRLIRTTYRSGYRRTWLSDAYPWRRWQELSPWMRALRVSLFISWAVAMISMCTVGGIEAVALRQPKIADALFVHPHGIKGGIRFFTDRQEEIYAVAKPLMIASWAVAFAFGVVLVRIEESWRKRKLQDLLDHVATEV